VVSLPFGIKCAPEIFQRIVDQMLQGIEGAAIMDDILIAGSNTEHHDTCAVLRQVIEGETSYNLKLNHQKSRLNQTTSRPIHWTPPHIGRIDARSIESSSCPCHAHPKEQRRCETIPRICHLVTYLAKFISNLSDLDATLRELLKTIALFDGQPAQEEAFLKLKEQCCSEPVLKYVDVNKPVKTQCDTSQHGLDAVLIQDGQPITYSSRSLTGVEGC